MGNVVQHIRHVIREESQVFAGRKAVIVKTFDEGTADRPYGHCIVAGVSKYPLKITKTMSQKRVAKRSKVKPFIKTINYNHMMPTRYGLDVELKSVVTVDAASNPALRSNARKEVKKALEERYMSVLKSGKSKWFFQKL